MSDQTKLVDFVQNARKENEAARAAALKESGDLPFLQLAIGENKLTLMPTIPTVRESSWGKMQYCFTVDHDGQLKTWTVTKNSPMALKVINLLLKAPVKLTVIRTGTGTSTRIDLKE